MTGGVAALVTALARHAGHRSGSRGALLALTAGEETADLGVNPIVPLAWFVSGLSERRLPGSRPEMRDMTVNVGTFHGGTKANLAAQAQPAVYSPAHGPVAPHVRTRRGKRRALAG